MQHYGISGDSLRLAALKKLVSTPLEKTRGKVVQAVLLSTHRIQKEEKQLDCVDLEDIIALCYPVPDLVSEKTRRELFKCLSYQLLQCLNQGFSFYGTLQNFGPTPWSYLTRHITSGLITFANHFESSRLEVEGLFLQYLDSFMSINDVELPAFFSLYGFIEGLIDNVHLISFQKLLPRLLDLLSAELLEKVEQLIDSATPAYAEIIENFLSDDNEFCSLIFVEAVGRFFQSYLEYQFCPNRALVTTCLQEKKRKYELLEEDVVVNTSIQNTPLIAFPKEIQNRLGDFLNRLLESSIHNCNLMDTGASFISLSSFARIQVLYRAKSNFLQILGFAIYSEVATTDDLKSFISFSLSHPGCMTHKDLGHTVVSLSALLAYFDVNFGYNLLKAYPLLLGSVDVNETICAKNAVFIASAMKPLTQDDVITTIYSLTNALSTDDESAGKLRRLSQVATTGNQTDNVSLDSFESHFLKNITTTLISFTKTLNDDSITLLVINILTQKYSFSVSVLDKHILLALADCTLFASEDEFNAVMKHFSFTVQIAFEKNNLQLVSSTMDVLYSISSRLHDSPFSTKYSLYLKELLSCVSNFGDVEELEHHRSNKEISGIAVQIAFYLKPLARLLPDFTEEPLVIKNLEITSLFQDVWYNMIIHGFSESSTLFEEHKEYLLRIARSSPPLASAESWNKTETSIRMNAVLRRGTSNRNIKSQKEVVISYLKSGKVNTRGFELQSSTTEILFLGSVSFLESLRVQTGICHKILAYFSDPSVHTTGVEHLIGGISLAFTKKYVQLCDYPLWPGFLTERIPYQLKTMMTYCCSRETVTQSTAFQCCDYLVCNVPSSLCHHTSLFSLLDILSLLQDSVRDFAENEYNPTVEFYSEASDIRLQLSDSESWRKSTLRKFIDYANKWVNLCISKCGQDVNSLFYSYLTTNYDGRYNDEENFGKSCAVQFLRQKATSHSLTKGHFSLADLSRLFPKDGSLTSQETIEDAYKRCIELEQNLKSNRKVTDRHILEVLESCIGTIHPARNDTAHLLKCAISIPFQCTKNIILPTAINFWLSIIKEFPQLSSSIIAEILHQWELSIQKGHSLFNRSFDITEPEFAPMEYMPSDRAKMDRLGKKAVDNIVPHLLLIRFFLSNFEATRYQSYHILRSYSDTVLFALRSLKKASIHPYARLPRFELIKLGISVFQVNFRAKSSFSEPLAYALIEAALSWFIKPFKFPFGGNRNWLKSDFDVLIEVTNLFRKMNLQMYAGLESQKRLLLSFLDHELNNVYVWNNVLGTSDIRNKYMLGPVTETQINDAFSINPGLAINLASRYNNNKLTGALRHLLASNPIAAIDYPNAVPFLLNLDNSRDLIVPKPLLIWEPVSPIDSIALFLPPYNRNPTVLQFAMRSLESYDVQLTFFYVPQIVQALRYDNEWGYTTRFVLETAQVSQLFAHQIIWNMMANSYKDEEATIPDDIKPKLDQVLIGMKKSFGPVDLEFYKREFNFFDQVTGISGKLKPYIKKSKAEKKIKIDEEMAKIEVLRGVYLPSNPNGDVVDIHRKSGKPLQSHAKAPFIASFKVRKPVEDDENGDGIPQYRVTDISAIFKVGDDCRQDVLALQLISLFRTIWMNSGVDLYVFPYKVTATAPGCGVIDVLPNSVSRDMLGREAVNGLYEYFISKFGPETSSEFQKARANFVKSLAAYSVISYLLQFKDRHNGNIMYDSEGHILHIDFGFCFDIVPGGVKFEQSPFKLTKEMVNVMGGNTSTQAYRWFEELCVKAFLSARPYMETIVRCIVPMLDSGLPCFKPATIKRLRARFVPDKTERQAANYMRGLISKSFESLPTKGYDEFQKITNGIPY
ncbi:hypothetical protein LJB42_000644 [Komagataella kurtzmanii]|nr:hypothetical protein LJB42_000644 [Komagataella kurtzmanii]